MKAERAAVADRATQDAAEDVAAAFVARLDAVGNRETERADVVGDHAESDVYFLLLVFAGAAGGRKGARVSFAAELLDLIEDRAEDIGLVIRDRAAEVGEIFRPLDDRGCALKAHPGIDVARRQRDERAVWVRVELDENEIPDLDAARITRVDQRAPGVAARREVDV